MPPTPRPVRERSREVAEYTLSLMLDFGLGQGSFFGAENRRGLAAHGIE